MAGDVPVQLGMFGVPNEVAGAHVVQAHTRVLANGAEVFVGEHLRWNRRGGSPVERGPRRVATVDDEAGQQDLFGAPE